MVEPSYIHKNDKIHARIPEVANEDRLSFCHNYNGQQRISIVSETYALYEANAIFSFLIKVQCFRKI